jgi:hypothetical protein
MHMHNQNPQPKIVLKPIIKLKSQNDTEIVKVKAEIKVKVKAEIKAEVKVKAEIKLQDSKDFKSEPTIKRKSNTNKTKTKLKQVSIDTIDITCSDIDSIDDSSCSSSSSSSSSSSIISIASESTTYIVPVYGMDMRMSFDNKFIYDMDFNHVGTVTDSKSIDWLD